MQATPVKDEKPLEGEKHLSCGMGQPNGQQSSESMQATVEQ